MTGARAGPHQRLVPAVPQPLDRQPRVRPGRGALRHAAATARASTTSTTARIQATRAGTRRACRARAHGADRRGRRAAQPGRAQRPATRRRLDGTDRPHRPRRPGQGLAGQPASPDPPTPTPAGSSPTACGTRSGSRSARRRPSSGSATSAGARARRSTASAARRAAHELRHGPATRAQRAAAGVRRGQPHALRVPLRRRFRRGHRAPPRVPARHRGGLRGRMLAEQRLRRRRAGLRLRPEHVSRAPTTARCSSPTTTATASGPCAPAPTALPSASLLQPFMSNGSGPVDLEIGPGGDLFYAGFDGGRRPPDQLSGRPTSVPTAVARATPTVGSAPLAVSFDGTGSTDPDPGDVAELRLGPRRRRRV